MSNGSAESLTRVLPRLRFGAARSRASAVSDFSADGDPSDFKPLQFAAKGGATARWFPTGVQPASMHYAIAAADHSGVSGGFAFWHALSERQASVWNCAGTVNGIEAPATTRPPPYSHPHHPDGLRRKLGAEARILAAFEPSQQHLAKLASAKSQLPWLEVRQDLVFVTPAGLDWGCRRSLESMGVGSRQRAQAAGDANETPDRQISAPSSALATIPSAYNGGLRHPRRFRRKR